ncbi:hypothetical protein D3C72_1481340 [compost metagenome]
MWNSVSLTVTPPATVWRITWPMIWRSRSNRYSASGRGRALMKSTAWSIVWYVTTGSTGPKISSRIAVAVSGTSSSSVGVMRRAAASWPASASGTTRAPCAAASSTSPCNRVKWRGLMMLV